MTSQLRTTSFAGALYVWSVVTCADYGLPEADLRLSCSRYDVPIVPAAKA